ncbi:MAG: bifunctional folylpolyglutamate synthase/dihydrofolate synthase [Novosphingobium sp.]
MRDFATSDSPAVQAQLDRLAALSLPQGRLGLETIHALLGRLGNPERALPPVFHVAGTNGKGSTCTFLRAMLEAQRLTVHSATKPHLVRYNERIRIAGKLIDDGHLAALLKEVLDAGEDLAPSFFEVTTAATFLAFHRVPADVCVIEVGLGGRFDATNVLDGQAACGIANLGIDHEGFLLVPEDGVPQDPMCRIAFEKAGIARAGVPLVTQAYAPEVTKTIIDEAMKVGARTAIRGLDWFAEVGDRIAYRDRQGDLSLPLPALSGSHQADNAALAVAMLRHQDLIEVSPAAMAEGIRSAHWPARLQQLGAGALTALVPGKTVLLDGAHNRNAAEALALAMAPLAPFDLVFGLMGNRRIEDVLTPLLPHVRKVYVVPVPGHAGHDPRDVAAWAQANLFRECYPAPSVTQALEWLDNRDQPKVVLIAGSLYLAGEVLRLNRELPQ